MMRALAEVIQLIIYVFIIYPGEWLKVPHLSVLRRRSQRPDTLNFQLCERRKPNSPKPNSPLVSNHLKMQLQSMMNIKPKLFFIRYGMQNLSIYKNSCMCYTSTKRTNCSVGDAYIPVPLRVA